MAKSPDTTLGGIVLPQSTKAAAPASNVSVSYNKNTGLSYNANAAVAAPTQSVVKKEDTPIAPVGKTIIGTDDNGDGTYTVRYSDGTSEVKGSLINPGSTGMKLGSTITLAKDTFKNTLALVMGEKEASQPWVDELFPLVQGFINTGSTVEEAQNLALREAKSKGIASKFVQRFSAVFKLQDRLNAGETVQVPTIAEYVNSEQALGDVFRSVGLGELATQDMAAKILGDANKSVAEATSLITDVFNSIDNAPDALKKDLQTYFPGVDRTAIAKALLTGKEGALELSKKVKSIEQVSAAKSQGVNIDLATGADLAAGGADYGTSLNRFATVKQLERGQTLGQMSGIDFTQQDALASTFQSNAAAQEKIRRIAEEEQNRYSGRSGRLASQNRDSGQY